MSAARPERTEMTQGGGKEEMTMTARPELARTTDDQLIEGFFSGCKESFDEIVHRYEQKVYNTALHLTDSVADAEEVLGQVFVSLYRELDRDAAKEPLFDWLIERTLNISVGTLLEKREEQDKRFSQPLAEHEKSVQREIPTFSNAMLNASRELPEKCRFVFILRDVQGLPIMKVAAVLGLNVFEARRRLHCARLLIRDALRPLLGQTEKRNVA